MKPFTDLKTLTFYELCAETQRAYEAKEIEWDELVAIAGQYAVYQEANKPKEKEQTWGEAAMSLLVIMLMIALLSTFGTMAAKAIYTYILFIWKNTII